MEKRGHQNVFKYMWIFEVYIVSLIYCCFGRLFLYSLIYSHHLDTNQWLVMVVLFFLSVIKVINGLRLFFIF